MTCLALPPTLFSQGIIDIDGSGFPDAYINSALDRVQFENNFNITNTGVYLIYDCEESFIDFSVVNYDEFPTETKVIIETTSNVIFYTGDPALWHEETQNGRTSWTRNVEMPAASGTSPSRTVFSDFTFTFIEDPNANGLLFGAAPVPVKLWDASLGEIYRTTVITDRVAVLSGPTFFSAAAQVSAKLTELMDPAVGGSATVGHITQIVVDGILYIDVPDVFFVGTSGTVNGLPFEVILRPGARIEIFSGCRLTMSGAVIRACDKMGDGINIDPGGALIATASTFSDCHKAINVPASPSAVRPTLFLSGCSFIDNYIGVNVEFSNSGSLNLLSFTGNTFASTAGILSGHEGYSDENGNMFTAPMPSTAGIGLAGIRIKNYRDFNPGDGNSFSNLAFGIVANGSNMNLRNLTFTNMLETPLYNGRISAHYRTGTGISTIGTGRINWLNLNRDFGASTFTNCVRGVNAIKMAGVVRSCTMNGTMERGVDWSLSSYRDIIIDLNNITASEFCVNSYFNEPVIAGSNISLNTLNISSKKGSALHCNESNSANAGWLATGNIISVPGSGNGILYRRGTSGGFVSNTINIGDANLDYDGIRLEYASNVDVVTNTINSPFLGKGSNGILSLSCRNDTIDCNVLRGFGSGLHILDMTTESIRGNSMSGANRLLEYGDVHMPDALTGPQFHAGNQFLGSTTWDAFHHNQGIVKASEYYVDPVENPSFDALRINVTDWFIRDITTPRSFGCLPITEGNWHSSFDEFNTKVATGTLKPTRFQTAFTWRAENLLFQKLLEEPSLVDENPLYANFYENKSGTTVGLFGALMDQLSSLEKLELDELEQLEALQAASKKEGEDVTVLELEQQNGTPIDASILAKEMLEYQVSTALLEQYDLDLSQRMQEKASQLRAVNATLPIDNEANAALQAVLDIYLQLKENAVVLSEEQNMMLQETANLCPVAYGDAVFIARSLLGSGAYVNYDDDAICAETPDEAEGRTGKEAKNEAIVQVFPNPTNDFVYWFVDALESVDAYLYDSQGRLLKSQIDTNTNSISLVGLPPSMYRLHVFVDGYLKINQNIVLTER